MRLRLRLEIIWRVSVLAFAIVLGPTRTPALIRCEVQRLTTEDTVPPRVLGFGRPVALSGYRAVVGARYSSGQQGCLSDYSVFLISTPSLRGGTGHVDS